MDPDNQPSTSKKGNKFKDASENKLPPKYPVTFEEFMKFANVEDYVIKEMERAGPEKYRINFKIRHKYYPTVYKQFYESHTIRDKMVRHGLTLKPIPNFLKQKLMLMPGDEAKASISTHKRPEKHAKVKFVQDAPKEVLRSTSSAVRLVSDKNIKKTNKIVEKESPLKRTYKPAIKNAAIDSSKITSFFTALELTNKSAPLKETGLNLDSRKRKSDTDMQLQTKRTRNAIQRVNAGQIMSGVISANSDSESNIKIMVGKKKLSHSMKSAKKPQTNQGPGRSKKQPTRRASKRKNNENQCKSRSDEQISDDSDIESQDKIEIYSLSSSKEMPQILKPPLPKRNRIEDFKKPTPSSRKCGIKKLVQAKERDQLSDSDAEMALLSLSGVSTAKMGTSKNEIHAWLEKGLTALEDDSNVEDNTAEYIKEEYIVIDRLTAINKYPNAVRNYIMYLMNIEIQKRKGTNLKPAFADDRPTPTSKVESAISQMTFEDFKNLINTAKLLTYRVAEGESTESFMANLQQQYADILKGKSFWPEGVHIKLSTLTKYLQSKGIKESIRLKDIRPGILCFEEVLKFTNLKECTSLSRDKPPDSYKHLLDLCKKEFLRCCAKGAWNDGMKFIDRKSITECVDTVDDSVVLFSEPMTTSPLKEFSSVLTSTQQSVNKSGDNPTKLSIADKSTNGEEIEKCLDQIFKESDEHDKAIQTKDTRDAMLAVSSGILTAELIQTLAGSLNRQIPPSLEISQIVANETVLTDALPVSLECIVIDHSTDSAGQLLSNIIQPSTNPTSIQCVPSDCEHDTPQEMAGLIPPSPNLFQSSGESVPKSQQIQPRSPETVYVPCNRSMTFNTEENNLTALSYDTSRENQDPFAETSANHEDTVVDQSNVLTQDTNVVVKQEPQTMRDVGENCSYSDLNDSIQIIDIPRSEPIVIEDEETAPDLLDLLLSRPNLATYRAPSNMDLTDLSHSGCTENFPQAQQLPSNFSLTQVQSSPQTLDASRETDAHNISNSNAQIRTDAASEVKSSCGSADINLVLNVSQESSSTEDQALRKRRITTRKTPTKNQRMPASYDIASGVGSSNATQRKTLDHSQELLTNESSSLDPSQPSEETPASGSPVQVSCVSIRSQNVPSEELTQSCSNMSPSQTMNLREVGGSGLKVPEYQFILEPVTMVNTVPSNEIQTTEIAVDQLTLGDTNEGYASDENFTESTQCTQESSLSVTVYVTQEGDVSDVLMSSKSTGLPRIMERSIQSDGDKMLKEHAEDVESLKNDADDFAEVSINDSSEVEVIEASDSESASELEISADVSNSIISVRDSLDQLKKSEFPRVLSSTDIFKVVTTQNKVTKCRSKDIELMDVSAEDLETRGKMNTQEAFAEMSKEVVYGSDVEDTVSRNVASKSILSTLNMCDNVDLSMNVEGEDSSRDNLELPKGFQGKINIQPGTANEVIVQDSETVKLTECFQEVEPLAQSVNEEEMNTSCDSKKRQIESDCISTSSNPSAEALEVTMELESQNPKTISNDEVRIHQPDQAVNLPKNISPMKQTTATSDPLKVHNRKTFNISAHLPIVVLQNAKTNDFVEAQTIIDEVESENENGNLVEIPLLIDRKIVRSLPFSIVTPEQLKQTTKESTIYTIKVNLEFNLDEHCVPTSTSSDHGQDQRQPHPCQFDANVISDWLGAGVIAIDSTTAAATSSNVQPKVPPSYEFTHGMSLEERQTLQRLNVKEIMKLNVDSNPAQKQPLKITKIPCKTRKKKTTSKQSESDFVPQKTHAFRSLVLGAGKKPQTDNPHAKQLPLTKLEEIDYLIEDASQVIASSTASQILGTDCTYFENSQLLRNIDDHCTDEQTKIPTIDQHPPPEPKVNTFNHIVMSEGLMARKVWRVLLQWKSDKKMSIEVTFLLDGHWFTVCDESAKLLFQFSPEIWSHILRVLREINHYDYQRAPTKNSSQVATPLHKVLRLLFDTVTNVVNVRVISDNFNPYARCEKATPMYRKPFQCLTKTIPVQVLKRMEALKENLRNNNTEM